MKAQTQAHAQKQTGGGRRPRLFQKPPLEREILALIAEVDKHLPAGVRDNDHYVAAARAVIKARCQDAEVDTGSVQLILTLRLLRDGDGLASQAHWPEGTQAKVARFFSQYPPVTIH